MAGAHGTEGLNTEEDCIPAALNRISQPAWRTSGHWSVSRQLRDVAKQSFTAEGGAKGVAATKGASGDPDKNDQKALGMPRHK